MNPVKTNETNFTYLGPAPEIADLPCHLDRRDIGQGTNTFTVWVLSDEERRVITEGGHVRLGIYGARPIPPVSLQVVPNAGPTERLNTPCDVCGKQPEDPVHDLGDDTHAFRSRSKLERRP